MLKYKTMDNTSAIRVFEALSSAVRLDVFRLLVKNEPTGLVAGEIAQTLGIQPTNLSFHLKALTHAGLLRASQEGRYLRYHAQVLLAHELVDYLTAECCHGNPAACGAPAGRTSKSPSSAARTRLPVTPTPHPAASVKRKTAATVRTPHRDPASTPRTSTRRAPARRGATRD
jgi:DNA-binding transcriptional ArsR family regulator